MTNTDYEGDDVSTDDYYVSYLLRNMEMTTESVGI